MSILMKRIPVVLTQTQFNWLLVLVAPEDYVETVRITPKQRQKLMAILVEAEEQAE